MDEVIDQIIEEIINQYDVHTLNEVKDLLRLSWSIMTVSQKLLFLESDEISEMKDEKLNKTLDSKVLIDKILSMVDAMEKEIQDAGFKMIENEYGDTSWRLGGHYHGIFYQNRCDAIYYGFIHMNSMKAPNRRLAPN